MERAALRTSASSKCRTGNARRTSVGEGRITVGTRSAYESTHHSAKKVTTPARARMRARWFVTGSRTFTSAGPARRAGERRSPRNHLEVRAAVLGPAGIAVVVGHGLVRAVAHHVEL